MSFVPLVVKCFMRVAGCDPGTSSLDMLALEAGRVVAQVRIDPDELRADPTIPVQWLRAEGPFDLIAGPSGYGLPLVRATDCTDAQLDLMSLVRPDERRAKGVGGFSAMLRALRDSGLPVIFLPGVIHLPTVPVHRKLNKIDLGTADKLCVAGAWTRAVLMSVCRALKKRGLDPLQTILNVLRTYATTGTLPLLPEQTSSEG